MMALMRLVTGTPGCLITIAAFLRHGFILNRIATGYGGGKPNV